MTRLATEFGISGTGLAKICNRLHVPYPPRGYWAKLEAGKAVNTSKLSSRPEGVPDRVEISPSPTQAPDPQPISEAIAAASNTIGTGVISDSLDNLHPKVRAWLSEHTTRQKEREQENKREKREAFGWVRPLIAGLTKRDLYRFRVTSTIFRAVEKAGGKIESAPIHGKVVFLSSGQKVGCSIVEKMVQSLLHREQAATWTAHPEFHQTGLKSSGFLRVTVTTYLGGKQPQWIETSKIKIADCLPEIVGTIMGAGHVLIERERERQESARRYQEEQARQWERQRLRQIDDKRWHLFQQKAADCQNYSVLSAFLAEVDERLKAEGDVEVNGQLLSQWLMWARAKTDALDPFKQGIAGLFDAITRVP